MVNYHHGLPKGYARAYKPPPKPEPEDLTEYLEDGLKRREGAEMRLRGLLGRCLLDPLIKRKRLDLVRRRAQWLFRPVLDSVSLSISVPYAVKEHPDDLLGDLCRLINEDRDFAADMAPSTEPRKCLTCGEFLSADFFYNYGSSSCRRCNVEGDRIPEAWRT